MFCERCGKQIDETHRFCEDCGIRIEVPTLSHEDLQLQPEEIAIRKYFSEGYTYKNIIRFLEKYHGIQYSLRTLKRRLCDMGLNKSRNVSIQRLTVVIEREISGPSSRIGYRNMWNLLRSKYNIQASRDTVMKILRELDPEGVEIRRSRVILRRNYVSAGPNDTWHVDGYDKLKPYGLPIHGAIDGFSRKILWLEVCRTNNNPLVPAQFFIETSKRLCVYPETLRTDCGTENGIQCSVLDNIDSNIGTNMAHQLPTSE